MRLGKGCNNMFATIKAKRFWASKCVRCTLIELVENITSYYDDRQNIYSCSLAELRSVVYTNHSES
jgi:hypothetical protein